MEQTKKDENGREWLLNEGNDKAQGPISSLLRTENGLTTEIFVVKYTGRGLVAKRPGILSKV